MAKGTPHQPHRHIGSQFSSPASANTVQVSMTFLTMPEAARELPGHPTVATVIRRIKVGIRGKKLNAIFDGFRYFTTKEWISEHLSDLSTKTVHRIHTQSEKEILEAFWRI